MTSEKRWKNTGALFRNEKGHFSGPLDIGGAKYKMAGWSAESKKGEKYLRIRVFPASETLDERRANRRP